MHLYTGRDKESCGLGGRPRRHAHLGDMADFAKNFGHPLPNPYGMDTSLGGRAVRQIDSVYLMSMALALSV
jgi:hypothetical protein